MPGRKHSMEERSVFQRLTQRFQNLFVRNPAPKTRKIARRAYSFGEVPMALPEEDRARRGDGDPRQVAESLFQSLEPFTVQFKMRVLNILRDIIHVEGQGQVAEDIDEPVAELE